MQICCALEVGTFFPEILQRMAIMALLSSITPLLNSQTSNKHFELTREIFINNILPTVDSWRPCLHTRGKSIVRYLGKLHNYWKTLPSTKIGKTNSPSKNTATRSSEYNRRQSVTKWVETLGPKLGFFYALLTSKEGNIAFPPHPLHAMLCRCSSYYKKTTNTPPLNGGDRGGVWILLFSEVNLFK